MSDGAPDVLVVGSINVDLVVRAKYLPRPGETVTGGTFERHQGGKGANQAVAAARFGARVTFVGAVGDDEFGRLALAALSDEGVDVSRVVTVPGVATGVALIIVDGSGENLIAVASGANASLSGAMVEETLAGWAPLDPANPGTLLVGYEIGDEPVLAAALLARSVGKSIVLNPAPARALPASLVELEPILLSNEGEARLLGGLDDPASAARALAGQTGAPVVVTLGARGALVVDGSSVTAIVAPSVSAVDATGAGDAFAGVLAAELAGGTPLAEAARSAVAAGSLSVTVAGAREGMPGRARVQALLTGN